MAADLLAEDVSKRHWRKNHWKGKIFLIPGQSDILGKVRLFFAGKFIKVFVCQGMGQLTGPVRPEVEEDDCVIIVDRGYWRS